MRRKKKSDARKQSLADRGLITVTIFVRQETHESLKIAARKRLIPISTYGRDALIAQLARDGELLEAAPVATEPEESEEGNEP